VGALNKWYAEHKDKAEFVIVYVREAHPDDGWQVSANKKDSVVYKAPETYEQRKAIAKACEVGLSLDIPIVIDKMDDAVEKAYSGWPDRIYVVDKDGKLAFVGAPGPQGFDTKSARSALNELIGG